MNWRVIRWLLVIILVVLNLGLFGYSMYLNSQLYMVPRDRIDGLISRFEDWGYELPEKLPRDQSPEKQLLLERNDLEVRADSFFTETFEKSYMVDARVLYTCGARTLTIDRERSTMIYADNEPVYEEDATAEEERDTAFQFAGQMFQNTDIRVIRTQTVDEDTTVYYICEVYEKQILFSNRIMVTMTHNTVTHASMTQYKVVGYGTTAQPVYPIDELLYSCRYDLETASAQETTETDLEQLSLYYGYVASRTEDNTIYCAPALWVGRADGSGLLVNRYTDEIMDLP